MTLEATRLGIGYGNTLLGSNISFSISRGDIVCLLGPNGCGKTTLFKTLLGLIPTLSGSVTLGGKPLSRLSRREIARQIAYVPQSHAPPFPFTVTDIILMASAHRLGALAQPGKRDFDAVQQVLDRLGIGDLAAQDYSRLSGGQRQLTLIARALFQDTPLLVMDEPSASLDFGNQARVLAEIARLASEASSVGMGIVFSTHDPDQALFLGARVILMQAGQVVASGPAREVLTTTNLTRVYGIPTRVERTESGRSICIAGIGESSDRVPYPANG